jgi:hypothetical protein
MKFNGETKTGKEQLAAQALAMGVNTLVVLEGDAPEQHNNLPVNLSGNIDAPSRFVEGRKADFTDAKRHCLVSKTEGKITLVLNEQSVTDKYVVQGKIEVAKKFKALGINDDRAGYLPEELANKFKLLRSMFVSNLEHAKICTTLRNLKAKVNKDLEQTNDRKGNVTLSFKQVVESNMPDSIKLQIPLLEGEEPVSIDVSVILEAEGGSLIKCYLESIDAAELIEQQFAQRVTEEVEKLKDFVTIIEY